MICHKFRGESIKGKDTFYRVFFNKDETQIPAHYPREIERVTEDGLILEIYSFIDYESVEINGQTLFIPSLIEYQTPGNERCTLNRIKVIKKEVNVDTPDDAFTIASNEAERIWNDKDRIFIDPKDQEDKLIAASNNPEIKQNLTSNFDISQKTNILPETNSTLKLTENNNTSFIYKNKIVAIYIVFLVIVVSLTLVFLYVFWKRKTIKQLKYTERNSQ
jgi:hypothetical protein